MVGPVLMLMVLAVIGERWGQLVNACVKYFVLVPRSNGKCWWHVLAIYQ